MRSLRGCLQMTSSTRERGVEHSGTVYKNIDYVWFILHDEGAEAKKFQNVICQTAPYCIFDWILFQKNVSIMFRIPLVQNFVRCNTFLQRLHHHIRAYVISGHPLCAYFPKYLLFIDFLLHGNTTSFLCLSDCSINCQVHFTQHLLVLISIFLLLCK